LPDQPLDFRPVIAFEVFVRKYWRRWVGAGLDPHGVEIAAARRQFQSAPGAEYWRVSAGFAFAHAAILHEILAVEVSHLCVLGADE
jgi:hypothetical protein